MFNDLIKQKELRIHREKGMFPTPQSTFEFFDLDLCLIRNDLFWLIAESQFYIILRGNIILCRQLTWGQ